jgi:hypothetical protein
MVHRLKVVSVVVSGVVFIPDIEKGFIPPVFPQNVNKRKNRQGTMSTAGLMKYYLPLLTRKVLTLSQWQWPGYGFSLQAWYKYC